MVRVVKSVSIPQEMMTEVESSGVSLSDFVQDAWSSRKEFQSLLDRLSLLEKQVSLLSVGSSNSFSEELAFYKAKFLSSRRFVSLNVFKDTDEFVQLRTSFYYYLQNLDFVSFQAFKQLFGSFCSVFHVGKEVLYNSLKTERFSLAEDDLVRLFSDLP